ncbi:DUF2238 domain-containing protein [uncultured Psychrobacter sp.]|uniref:DUF2238 domain-containing protein n=1 Tax=uncultured Psychrobacter sp. TaxID=259303 RepID=UPI00345A9125
MSKFSKPVFASTITVIIVMVLASIEPMEWASYLLHQLGTLLFLAFMLLTYFRRYISSHAYVLAALFLIIHIVGARYLYSFVPYDNWTQQLFGLRLSEVFGWQRNMYDRLVHFSYGLLLFQAMLEIAKAIFKLQSIKLLITIVLMINMSTSLLYELFEWSLALTMSPEAAEAYNGQQGDIWDAHQDMAWALLGGLIGAGIVFLKTRKNQLKF